MFVFIVVLIAFGLVSAENGIDGWLRYARITNAQRYHKSIPNKIVTLNSTEGSPVFTAGQELRQGLDGIFGKQCGVSHRPSSDRTGTVTVGTLSQLNSTSINAADIPELIEDGFWLDIKGSTVNIIGQNERGALHGTFQYLERLAQANVKDTTYASNPDAPIRWINQWDNLRANQSVHGSVERGYGGPSIFFQDGQVKQNLTRVAQYARLLSSIGINAIIVNNVNANESFLTPPVMDGLGRIADTMRPYGIRIGMSLYFASPLALRELPTFDPLDPEVVDWWHNRFDEVYKRVPDFAGVLVKANSEGQPGPLTYNRTLAEGANLFARALAPHGGIVMFRAFVYDSTTLNQTTNWRADRANAAVEFFRDLDEEFDDNVVVQVKYGPIDFQVREPVSPLFAHLQNTASAVELQISQEYLGQQCHLVYLPPLWQTILSFDLKVDGQESKVRDIISGKRFGNKLGGYAGVANVGTNQTWLGSHLAMSNLYAFGRLAWAPTADSETIIRDWTRLTFGSDPQVVDVVAEMSLESWRTYENYTGNLGIQTLTDILYAHYGANPASQDFNPWGQWTRADGNSIGMDRTVYNGTRFSGQYPPEVAEAYENIETTPDDLILWFHHVPYTQLLKSGKTVIQHFYDSHYLGSQNAQTYAPRWEALKNKIDKQRYDEVLFRFIYQAGHSIIWRDSINNFYFNLSSIPDEAGRVENHPYRIEAENMQLDGYVRYAVSPFNSASGKTAVVTASNTTTGTISTTLENESGRYDVAVNYFDMAIGRSTWELDLGDRLVGSWIGDSDLTLGHAPSNYIDAQSATRITFKGVEVQKGDVLRVVGKPDGIEPAPVDYISIFPEGVVD
ncbi:alpha-glucuronidase [Elsinoe ampelina]|uniref:Alpha-glucuronidase n=1 Tax=Elsinoe ampelina TaxID=302913 RepID=A0A6A6GIK3_9PEZI|nr:alpha-glucuronidase [Elsinoe ampelina]